MKIDELKCLVRDIVANSLRLSATHTSEKKVPVNYACVFTHGIDEYEDMINVARQLGPIAKDARRGVTRTSLFSIMIHSRINILESRASASSSTRTWK